MDDKEKRIQDAMKNAEALWDDKYSQEDWETKPTPRLNMKHKYRRIGGGFASKALKNLY